MSVLKEELLNQSLFNIRKIFKGQIIIVGNKHLGKINPFLMDGLTKKSLVRTTPPRYVVESNNKLKNLQIIQNDSSISVLDLQELLIDRSGKGIPFDENGNLLSYDGGHLTKAGAQFLVKQLNIN